jgi:sugar lactone lactonase YvrE
MHPPSIRPTRWSPPPAPARAQRSTSDVPLPRLRTFELSAEGPEDVLVDPDDGTVLTGVADGRVLRLHPDEGTVAVVADTGGRPLGLEWLPDGRLLVCDARRGLLAADPDTGDVEVLVTEVAGQHLGFCNNAAVAPDGTIWFSDSSARFGIDVWKADILEHGGTGRLLRRDPSGDTQVVTDGLQFANGVALAGALTRVVVAETGSYCLTTCPAEPGMQTPLPLLTNLPGFPDNISTGTDGLVWVALASPRDAAVDALAPLPGLLRRIVWALPDAMQPKPADQVWVVAVDPDSGRVVRDLQGSHPEFGMATGVREHRGRVWLGSLVGTTVACFDVPTT